MQEFKDKVEAIIGKYEEQLAAKGIKIAAFRRYFEVMVGERSGSVVQEAVIFDMIDRARDRKKEKENGYHYENNKYHCIVLTVLPIDKNLVRKEHCREYAFLLRKVERAHIGQEPRRVTYEEERVLAKIEKRILKFLRRAQKQPPQKVCKDTFRDVLRYAMAPKYEYKAKILGKERSSWEMLFIIAAGVLAILIVFIPWVIGKLL